MTPLFLLLLVAPAFGQTIDLPETDPCFLQYEDGADILVNCGIEDDFLAFVTAPFEYATGGFFTMILITVFILISYMKYHKMLYPMVLGVLYFPSTYFLFPENFVTFGMTIMAIGYGIILWYAYTRQTSAR